MSSLARSCRSIPEELRAPSYDGTVQDDKLTPTVSSPSALVNDRPLKRVPCGPSDLINIAQRDENDSRDKTSDHLSVECHPSHSSVEGAKGPKLATTMVRTGSDRDWNNSDDMYAPEEATGSTEALQPSTIKEAASRLSDSKTTDWKLRLAAIDWLRAEVQTETGKVNVTENLVMLSNPLIAQIRDLRSAIVRETCNMIKLFADQLGNALSVIAPELTKTLLTITGGGNKVIAGYCEDCVFEVIRKSESPNSIPTYFQSPKHNDLKVLFSNR